MIQSGELQSGHSVPAHFTIKTGDSEGTYYFRRINSFDDR